MAQIIKVFVGSPSDTSTERSRIKGIINELNQTLGDNGNVVIQSVMWENEVQPTIGLDGQDVINSQVRDFDIFVGIMWKKYGNPTPRAGSPTDEEYSYALESYRNKRHCKDIIFMFSKIPFNIDEVDPLQLVAVKKFRNKVEKDGVLYKTYNTINDFERLLRVALYHSVSRLLGMNKQNTKATRHIVKDIPNLNIDDRTKLVFDTLSISPAVNNVKTKFIESYILLYLHDEGYATSYNIIQYLCEKLGAANLNLYNAIFSKLNQSDSIESEGSGKSKIFKLSLLKKKEIDTIKQNAQESIDSAIKVCQEICDKYDIDVDVNEINNYIGKLFSKNYSIDNAALSKGIVNRERTMKLIYAEFVLYIRNRTGLPAFYVEPIAEEFVSAYSKNQFFYRSNISKMFLNLFHNEKLEEYLSTTKRELLLDTQILLQICCVSSDDVEPVGSGILYRVGKRFWKIVNENKLIDLYTTTGYIQEVTNHMKQAVELSRFLSLDYIINLGRSKNVFFNHYLSVKVDRGYTSFEEYVIDMIGLDESDITSPDFANKAYRVFYDTFSDLCIKILPHQDVDDFNSFKRDYENELSYAKISRSFEARINDINAAVIAGNAFGDFEGTPYMVTLDSFFERIRDKFVEKYQNSIDFWHVTTPQKVSEMLSLIHFKVDPDLVDDNIISLTESNFNTSNETISFLDLLNSIIDKRELGEWSLAKKLSNLRKICQASTKEDILTITNLPIDEILSELINKSISDFHIRMSDIQELFCDNEFAEDVTKLIQSEIDTYKPGIAIVKMESFDKLRQMIECRKRMLKQ